MKDWRASLWFAWPVAAYYFGGEWGVIWFFLGYILRDVEARRADKPEPITSSIIASTPSGPSRLINRSGELVAERKD